MWKPKMLAWVLCTGVLLAPLALLAAEGEPPLDIGTRLELFVDDYLIESMRGVNLKLHQPRSAGKVFTFDQPWEGNTSTYVTILHDGGVYKMYYRGSSAPDYAVEAELKPGEELVPEHEPVACYAESRDGIRWTRPSLGTFEFNGSGENNIIWMGRGSHNFSPFIDGNPAAPPSERYKAVAGIPLLALTSADGIRWEKVREEPVISDGRFDSQNVVFWDDLRGEYVAIYRDLTQGVRTIKSSTSRDFLNWTPGKWAEFGEVPLEHLYTNATVPYFRAPHIYLGFPKRFLPWRQPPHLDSARPGLSDAVFMSSRDGVRWTRFMEAFIRPGRDRRNWIHRANMVSRGILATAPDEISLYVVRHYTYPSAHLERMVLRTDGFVSVHAGYGGGEFVTRPLIFAGTDLVLNYATSAAGSIRLEIQDVKGRRIPGFSLEDSPVIYGDEIEGGVKWEHLRRGTHRLPLARLKGTPVRLRFVLREADLYSLQFRD